MPRFTATQINKAMKEVSEGGFVPKTSYQYIRQEFNSIMEGGTVLSHAKALEKGRIYAQEHGQEWKPLTRTKYNKILTNLSEKLEDVMTPEGAENEYRKGATQIIDDYNKWNRENGDFLDIDIDTIDIEDLKDILNTASQAMGHREKGDSPKLFEEMKKIYETYYS